MLASRKRTVQTAEALLLGLDPILDERIREQTWGVVNKYPPSVSHIETNSFMAVFFYENFCYNPISCDCAANTTLGGIDEMLHISAVSDARLAELSIYDLPNLARYAALELDNYCTDLGKGVEATSLVVQWLQDRVDEYGCGLVQFNRLSVSDSVFLHHLMQDTKMLNHEVRYVGELLDEVKKVRTRLTAVVREPAPTFGSRFLFYSLA